jgi:hypothetical protein
MLFGFMALVSKELLKSKQVYHVRSGLVKPLNFAGYLPWWAIISIATLIARISTSSCPGWISTP